MSKCRTIVIGLGNPLLGDDGVGWKVAEQVTAWVQSHSQEDQPVDVECLSLGGLSLMEQLIGYDQAILIDAISLEAGDPGSVISMPLDALPGAAVSHTSSVHDTTLQKALELGRSLGAPLPSEIYLVGIQADVLYDFSEVLSVPVAAAIPRAAQAVLDQLHVLQGEQNSEPALKQ